VINIQYISEGFFSLQGIFPKLTTFIASKSFETLKINEQTELYYLTCKY